MLSHGYIKNDFDVQKWAAPEFLEQAAKELLEEQWKKTHDGQAARGNRAAGVHAANRIGRAGDARCSGVWRSDSAARVVARGRVGTGAGSALDDRTGRCRQRVPGSPPFPRYRINEQRSGFGYLGWAEQARCGLQVLLPGQGGQRHAPAKWVQIWAGLITVYDEQRARRAIRSQLRPFAGPQVPGGEPKEVALFQLDALTVAGLHRDPRSPTSGRPCIGSATRRASRCRSLRPPAPGHRSRGTRSADVEPIYRSDTGEDRLRCGFAWARPRGERARVDESSSTSFRYTRPRRMRRPASYRSPSVV